MASFPPDEGQLGDICPQCKWECDILEDDEGGASASDSGWSSANGDTLENYRTAWYHSQPVEAQRAYVIRVVVKKRAEVWRKLDNGMTCQCGTTPAPRGTEVACPKCNDVVGYL